MSTRNFESQLKMDRLPPRINSLRLQQTKFWRDTELAIAHVHVDLFVDGAEDTLLETAPSKHPDKHLCQNCAVETIMPASSTTVLDQIAPSRCLVVLSSNCLVMSVRISTHGYL